MKKNGSRSAILTVLLVLAFMVSVFGQKQSYLYIQGDKAIPFYVKVNGVMVNRFFKNHVVVPRLEQGSYDVEILFEKNSKPPLTFRIDVPDNGHRGYLLCANNGIYNLYDLETKTWLAPMVR